MKFHYVASQADGRIIEGDIDARSKDDVLNALSRKGLKPVSVREITLAVSRVSGRFFGQRINTNDKVFLTKYLSLMLKAGIDLFKAIDILVADFEKPVVRAFLSEVRLDLEKGQPFHAAFARYPKFFSPVFVNLIKAGEASGNLDVVFADLNKALEKENELRSKIRSALVYPVLLLVMATVILIFLVTFALPKIAEVFQGGGFNPPLFSRIVFAVGLFLNEYVFLILGLGAVFLAGAGFFIFKTENGKRLLSRFLNIVPLVRVIIKELALQRFAATFSSLLKSGLPVVESLEVTSYAVGHQVIKESLQRIAREGIIKGLTIGDAFKRETAFPNVVTNLVAISEKAGHLDEILNTLGDFYETEIDSSLKILISFLEPALLLVIGVVVALIALAIIIPIYQLVGQFS